jgi:hypothetical protein
VSGGERAGIGEESLHLAGETEENHGTPLLLWPSFKPGTGLP